MISHLAAAGDGGNPAGSLLFFAVIGTLFYLLAIRPNRRRMRQVQQVQSALTPGREVMTTAGVYGTVAEIDDESVRLEVAPGVVVRFARVAVVRVIDDEPAEPENAEPETEPAES